MADKQIPAAQKIESISTACCVSPHLKKVVRTWGAASGCAGLIAWSCLLGACAQGNLRHDRPQPSSDNARVATGAPVSLAINGFNYTDLPIDYFSVGGGGGSNLVVSSPTSGGGGTTCCITWRPGTTLPVPITVEWMRYVNHVQRWCEKTVLLTGPVPAHPSALGVHFMPDGDIRVEITQGEADPLLKLQRFGPGRRKEEGNAVHDEEVARCRDGR